MDNFEHKKREILDRVDILDVVSEQVQLRRTGRRWVGLCPFHAEKTPSFTVHPERGFFKCFGCGKGGDVISFLQYRENMPFMDALRLLADRAGITLETPRQRSPSSPGRADLARVNRWAVGYFRDRLLREPAAGHARQYLDQRGITAEGSERFALGVALGNGGLQNAARGAGFEAPVLLAADLLRRGEDHHEYETFRNRLLFPIRDVTGRVIGFGGRTLGDDRAKYLNTRQTDLFDKGRHLYGIDVARDAIRDRGRVIIVEGYTDCIAAHKFGFAETVATMGTALTDAHVAVLRRYTDRIILVFDGDQAGEAAAERAMRVALPASVGVRLTRLPPGEDPSDFLGRAGADAFSELLKGAVDALEYKWSQTQIRFRTEASTSRRREAVEDFLRIVAESVETRAVDAIQRGLIVNQVAHLLRIGHEEISRYLTRQTARSRRRTADQPDNSPTDGRGNRSVPDGEQAAWSRVLEVLLNEPGLLTTIDDFPDVDRITHPCDRRIARILVELVEQFGEVNLNDVLARFDASEDVERVTLLAQRGERRGNGEATLLAALETIRAAVCETGWALQQQRLPQPMETGDDPDATRLRLAVVGEAVRSRRGFLPRRFHHRPVGHAGSDPEDARPDSMEQS